MFTLASWCIASKAWARILSQSHNNYKSTALSKYWYFLFVMHGSFKTSPRRTPSLVRAREGLSSLVRKSNATKLITIIVTLFNSGRQRYFLENNYKFLYKYHIAESSSTFYKITIIFFLKFELSFDWAKDRSEFQTGRKKPLCQDKTADLYSGKCWENRSDRREP